MAKKRAAPVDSRETRYVAVMRLKHSITGVYYLPGAIIDLAHLSETNIDALIRASAIRPLTEQERSAQA